MSRWNLLLLLIVLDCFVHGAPATPVSLAETTIQKVKDTLTNLVTDSWVAGALSEALLELDTPVFSVFKDNRTAFPLSLNETYVPTGAIKIAQAWSAKRPVGAQQLAVVSGGSAGDPASLGVAWLWAEMTETDGDQRAKYGTEVDEQASYLLTVVPRTSDRAISMRPPSESVQLWSDFMYMVPPFLAFYGVTRQQREVVLEAYNQCKLYRSRLRDPSTGYWRHIVLGKYQDTGFWGTGMGWAAAGMARVLATLGGSPDHATYSSQMSDLADWTNEILDAVFMEVPSSNLLPNYYGVTSFSDAASSALLASAAYRISALGYATSSVNVEAAHKVRRAVFDAIGLDGWLSPVVDPLYWAEQVPHSPEAQVFVLLLQAAYIDWLAKNPNQ